MNSNPFKSDYLHGAFVCVCVYAFVVELSSEFSFFFEKNIK